MKVFAVKRTCIVREGFALDSERRGVLQKGQDVEALELGGEKGPRDHPSPHPDRYNIFRFQKTNLCFTQG